VLGVAGSNYCLYDAISRMDAAVADVIQFTAPVIVALWMWARGFEPMDKPKAVALVLSMSGVVLALGVFERHARVTGMGAAMAGASAIAYSFLIVWGKHLSRQYSRLTMLHYGFLAASVFWFFVNPPWRLAPRLADPSVLGMTVVMSLTSVVVPYSCFFAGLKRVSASRAGIVSTFEPVFIAICAWALLGENLLPIQLAGIALVLSAIVIVEAYPRGRGRA
jgi:drug/metabolite transporter (DMT)-like permease